jgi:hypothetical protein
MAIVATDLVAYAAANRPTDDVSTAGGAIEPKIRVEFTDLAANDDIEIISSSASDTQNCTVTARGADGVITSQTAALTGTTAKIFNTLGVAGVIERIESVVLASDAIGTITVRRSVAGATIATIPIGERGFTRLFVGAVSSPDNAKDYYEKVFFKNNHATLALQAAAISESADPTGLITFALATTINDSVTIANRLTAPAGGLTFDNSAKNVAGTNLAAGAAQGVWLKLALAQNNAPNKNTWTGQIAGNTA